MNPENNISNAYLDKQAEQSEQNYQNQAMQRYLRYLKSDKQPLTQEEAVSFQAANNAWYRKPVSYPPFED